METLWAGLMVTAAAAALIGGRTAQAGTALLESGQAALRLMLVLGGSMTLWGGLMEILHATGDLKRLSGWLRHLLRPLFPGVEAEDAWEAIGMNLAANMMGLGNAATPAGIRAAKLLTRPEQGESGVRALAMLLALNNSGLDWMPATVMTMRAASGAANPADVWLPTVIVSGVSTVVTIALMKLGGRIYAKRGAGGAA